MRPSAIASLASKTGRVIAALCLAFSVHAVPGMPTFDPKEMLSYKPFGDGEAILRFAATDTPVTVDELDPFAVVNYGKGERCPSGGFYLVNTVRRYYQFVDAGTCSAELTVSLTRSEEEVSHTATTHLLTFSVRGTIVARYPLYGY